LDLDRRHARVRTGDARDTRRRAGTRPGQWPAPQGTNFTKIGVETDFTSAKDGFAWTTGDNRDPAPATLVYERANSGRSWHVFTPYLVG
jgi:hypothetical protein